MEGKPFYSSVELLRLRLICQLPNFILLYQVRRKPVNGSLFNTPIEMATILTDYWSIASHYVAEYVSKYVTTYASV
jgi:hypothetical protein